MTQFSIPTWTLSLQDIHRQYPLLLNNNGNSKYLVTVFHLKWIPKYNASYKFSFISFWMSSEDTFFSVLIFYFGGKGKFYKRSLKVNYMFVWKVTAGERYNYVIAILFILWSKGCTLLAFYEMHFSLYQSSLNIHNYGVYYAVICR